MISYIASKGTTETCTNLKLQNIFDRVNNKKSISLFSPLHECRCIDIIIFFCHYKLFHRKDRPRDHLRSFYNKIYLF